MLIFCIRSSEIFCAWGGSQKRIKRQCFKKLNTEPAIPLLGIRPRELETYVHIKTCTRTFISALFPITKTWKQPKCLSPNEWINKMWHIHMMEFYSSIKRNRVQIYATTWINLENFMLQKKARHKRHMLYNSI